MKDDFNVKFLCPTFRTRYLHIRNVVQRLYDTQAPRFLNIGCGEGDYDPLLKTYSKKLYAGDINESDIQYCKQFNKDKNIIYQTMDIENLDFKKEYFDGILCTEVLEHVSSIKKSLKNVHRVLKKGGYLIVTIPISSFPVTYDPINRFLHLFGKHLSIGAHGYGHDKLITGNTLLKLLEESAPGLTWQLVSEWSGDLQTSRSRNR